MNANGATARTPVPFSPILSPRSNLHALKWGLTALGLFVGMCGVGYLAAAIVMDHVVNAPR